MSCTPDYQISNQLRPVALEIRLAQISFPMLRRMSPEVAQLGRPMTSAVAPLLGADQTSNMVWSALIHGHVP